MKQRVIGNIGLKLASDFSFEELKEGDLITLDTTIKQYSTSDRIKIPKDKGYVCEAYPSSNQGHNCGFKIQVAYARNVSAANGFLLGKKITASLLEEGVYSRFQPRILTGKRVGDLFSVEGIIAMSIENVENNLQSSRNTDSVYEFRIHQNRWRIFNYKTGNYV